MRLSEQVAALEEAVKHQSPEWIVVGVETYHFRIARKNGNRYDIQGRIKPFRHQEDAEAFIAKLDKVAEFASSCAD